MMFDNNFTEIGKEIYLYPLFLEKEECDLITKKLDSLLENSIVKIKK